MKRLRTIWACLGSGIFAIGYTIGTGSVTSMAKAGADYGLGLVWVLALSCLFSGVLMEAYGRMAAVTGETSLRAIRNHLPCGKVFAWLVFAGVVMGQYTCLGGILTLSSGAISEMFGGKVPPFAIAVAISVAMYALLMIGRYSAFEKILALFVGIMTLTFLVSVFVTMPDAVTLAKAAKPILPTDGNSLLMLASFVGTTMAAPTFVTRPLIIREKGLTAADLGRQRIDSWFSAAMMFVISGSIVFVATGALWAHGKGIDRILDMAGTLEPLAGKAAVVIFMFGVLAAGLSSIFPILMVAPILLSDYKSGKMETNTPLFRVICLVACLWALVVPALGGNPVVVTISAQISNVFVLPLTVLAILLLLNRKDLMGAHRAGVFANAGLAFALVFSLGVAYTGGKALGGFLKPDDCCIFDRIENCEKYAKSARLQNAFEFLRRPDLATLQVGRHEIDGDRVFALVQECELRPVSQMKVESHRRYIDIQAPLDGVETYGYGRLSDEKLKQPFDAMKDIGFHDQKVETVDLKPGEFAMFLPPYGAHGPGCTKGASTRRKKIVIKVLVEDE